MLRQLRRFTIRALRDGQASRTVPTQTFFLRFFTQFHPDYINVIYIIAWTPRASTVPRTKFCRITKKYYIFFRNGIFVFQSVSVTVHGDIIEISWQTLATKVAVRNSAYVESAILPFHISHGVEQSWGRLTIFLFCFFFFNYFSTKPFQNVNPHARSPWQKHTKRI